MISAMQKTQTESRIIKMKFPVNPGILREIAKMRMQFIQIRIFPTIISMFSRCRSSKNRKKLCCYVKVSRTHTHLVMSRCPRRESCSMLARTHRFNRFSEVQPLWQMQVASLKATSVLAKHYKKRGVLSELERILCQTHLPCVFQLHMEAVLQKIRLIKIVQCRVTSNSLKIIFYNFLSINQSIFYYCLIVVEMFLTTTLLDTLSCDNNKRIKKQYLSLMCFPLTHKCWIFRKHQKASSRKQ